MSAADGLNAFSEQARRLLGTFPQTEFMIFPELHLHAGPDFGSRPTAGRDVLRHLLMIGDWFSTDRSGPRS